MKNASKPEKKLVKSVDGQNEVSNAKVEIVNLDGPEVAKVSKVSEGLVAMLKEGVGGKEVEKEKEVEVA